MSNTTRSKCTLTLEVSYDPAQTTPADAAEALDALLVNALSTPGILDAIGNPGIGSFDVAADDEALQLLRRLVDWGKFQGGWESPVWDDAVGYLQRHGVRKSKVQDERYTLIPVRELQEGDLVDLEKLSCVDQDKHPIVCFELCEVLDIDQETDDCIAVSFEGVDRFGLHPDQIVYIQSREYEHD
jgi:hypothetical protein